MDEECPGEVGPSDGYLLVRIHVPELNVQKCLQFPRDQLVWDVKQQCLASVPKVATWFRELKESFNYGLFSPAQNGRAGKFLDEERRLGDYPFSGPVGYLELKYKRRVYKMVNLDEKQLRALHTRTNYRRMLDYVNNGHVEKIGKMCGKGFDPNFHCPESGETPLTLATATKNPGKMLIALVNGGAILDFRTKDGATAVHRAVAHNSLEALKTLLELGASPNYKDAKGLTPLFHSVSPSVDAAITEMLLHDHATTGAADLQGWREVHHACRGGLLTHLEHLIFYGADLNVQNASGNTPLHVCAVDGQESCARLLLFRGADKGALNFANQTPYQVAVIAGNLELAEVIKTHRPEEVVAYREPPCLRQQHRRRMSCIASVPQPQQHVHAEQQWRSTSPSLCSLCGPASYGGYSLRSSASSSMSDASSQFSHVSSLTDKSLADTSDIISESSGVGTSSDTNVSLVIGTTVVCVQPYASTLPGHLTINPGDIIEVTGCNEDGMLEGRMRNLQIGQFPTSCVEEIRNGDVRQMTQLQARIQGRRETVTHFATAPRLKRCASVTSEPRTVVLHRARKGFGFVLRGAKAASPLMELVPSGKCPALQYLDDVDEGGVADRAGLKKGDYLIAINGEDVSTASHEHVVDLIRRSGDLVQMTVVSLEPNTNPSCIPSSKSAVNFNGIQSANRQCVTLPRNLATGTLGRSKAPLPPRRDPNTTLSMGRSRSRQFAGQFADLEDENRFGSSAESIHQDGNHTPRTASVRARPISSRITASELEELFQRQRGDVPLGISSTTTHPSATTVAPGSPRVYASVAEMKRSKNKGLSKFRLFTSKKQPPATAAAPLHRDFHSTPDLFHHPPLPSSPLPYHSHDDVTLMDVSSSMLPPPTSPPPPPPPVCEIVPVETRTEEKRGVGVLVAQGEMVRVGAGGVSGEVMSSFRPCDTARLYAKPEEVRSVGFRCRTQVRKTQSLKSPPRGKSPPRQMPQPAPTPATVAQPVVQTSVENTNPYAQPFRPNVQRTLSKEKAPMIPDPDYSDEEEPVKNTKDISPETSGNSNSSSGSSGAVPHSFSVQEIQQVRTKLKSSKSYPNDFLLNPKEPREIDGDGDNSSSGVSSDQDVPAEDVQVFHRQNSIRISNKQKAMQIINSLAHLPPPLEEEPLPSASGILPPPPPEFNVDLAPEMEVLAPPPPQFSDGRSVTRVRIGISPPK